MPFVERSGLRVFQFKTLALAAKKARLTVNIKG